MRQFLFSGLLVSVCLPLSSAVALGQSASVSSSALDGSQGSSSGSSQDAGTSASDLVINLLPDDYDSGAESQSGSRSESVTPEQAKGRTAQAIGPYDPLGIRLGQFLLYPSLTLWGEVTDNVDGTANGEEGRIVTPEAELRVETDWSRHALDLSARGAISAYDAPVRKPDTEENLSAELRLDLADETQLTLDGGFAHSKEESSVELTATGQAATYETNVTGGVTLDHRAGLLDLQLRGSAGAMRYENESSRDYDSYRLGARIGVPVTDQIIPFIDAEIARRSYNDASQRQNGDSLRGAIGIEVVNREKLSGEISAGVIAWEPDLAGLSGDTAMFADASLVWSPNGLWTIRGGLETDLTSTATAARSVATHSVSLSADYALLRNLNIVASGEISRESYNGLSRRDWVLDAALNATYSFNRTLQLIASVERSQRESNWAGEDTTTSTVRVGLKIQR